jgi:ParB family chromosome partitioning protein
MTKAVQKITLSPSRDIPFNKLVLSQSNVRCFDRAASRKHRAAYPAAEPECPGRRRCRRQRDRHVRGAGGGRRYRALELLVKQKRMSKTQTVPCVVREGGIAEDDSVAENDERVGLHPLDQFRAFQTLRDLGMTEEDIAARHFVTSAIVTQRLRLASVSPKLHEVYAEDGMTLEQLMAFSVTAVVVEQWPSQDGHYPVAAYQTAFGLCLALQAATLVWFAIPWLRTFGKHFYFFFAPPPAERDSQVALVTAPLDGAVLEASERMEW